MRRKESCITSSDLRRLRDLIETTREFHLEDDVHLGQLENELDRAKVVEPEDAPKTLVTMNCRIQVRDLDTGEAEVYWLVYPGKSNGLEGHLSILAPVGVALLGKRAGDVVQVEVPTGLRRIRVEHVVHEAEADDTASRA